MATVSQIASDPALETSLFWDQYKIPVIAIALVLVLGGLGFTIYEFHAQRQTAEAAALLSSATTPQDFQQVIDRYAGSGPAASAYLLLAEEQRAKKSYSDANVTLHKFIDQFPKHELITSAWMGVAANLDSLGKSGEALSTYQRLVAEYPQSFNAPLALLAEVPLLKANNKIEDARRACESIISQYRDSVIVSEAIRELQRLPKITAPIAPAKNLPQPTPTR